ncbi:YybH family protein [Portibacter marinus]|uniref:YybH family protein n=1 Tax=Portibacter marinus TaxID=2898660 RepID=UPI001F2393C0|nr:nuclear transport factor 2 family protein [Portibacter marinus]
MKVKLMIFCLFTLPFLCSAQISSEDREEIIEVMNFQENAWNEGDIPAFMEGYWKSDSLRFTSSGRTNMGWQNTLEGYIKAYPTLEKMGKLTFEIFDIYPITDGSAALTGSYYLERMDEDLSGFFTLIWRKIDEEWKIVSDMTCTN